MDKKPTGKDLIAKVLKEFGFNPPPNPSAAEIQTALLILILMEVRKGNYPKAHD